MWEVKMDNIRIGIIGYGSMAHAHAKYLYDNQIKNGSITAVFDINQEKTKDVNSIYNGYVKAFHSLDDFYDSNLFDAVLIATPHYFHPEYAIKSFQKGYHVLCEKPAGVYTK